MTEPTLDPLAAFFGARAKAVADAGRFDGGEHLWLGNEGAGRALELAGLEADRFEQVKRLSSPESLSYGEIVALSGDFYETAADLFEERPGLIPWLWEDNDLSDIIAVFDKELAWIRKPPEQRGTSYPQEALALWWNAKNYAELALRNTDHFGWDNVRTYVVNHELALTYAAESRTEADPTRRDQQVRRAIYTSAFADHFLTDAFSAGHVRVPAREIREWGAARGMRPKTSGGLIKFLHDQDGHVEHAHGGAKSHSANEGLPVVSAACPAGWFTRCDGQLFLTGEDEPAVEQAVLAVQDSVGELLGALHGGPPVDGVFAATRRLPWPDPSGPALIDKFAIRNAEDRAKMNAALDNMPRYIRFKLLGGLEIAHVEALLEALPELMAKFRARVAAEASAAKWARERVDPAYVAGISGAR